MALRFRAERAPWFLQPIVSMKLSRRICFACTALVMGCSVEETVNPAPVPFMSKCQSGVIGDPKKFPEIEIIAITSEYQFETIGDGDSVSLLQPPGSGRVLFAGARVRNMNPCGVRLRGEFMDPISGKKQIDIRIINMEPTEDGWASSSVNDLSTLMNQPVCPNQWAMQDIFDNEFQLTMIVTDRDDRLAWKSVRVIPKCDEPGQEAGCTCLCSDGYKLGQVCSNMKDAGP